MPNLLSGVVWGIGKQASKQPLAMRRANRKRKRQPVWPLSSVSSGYGYDTRLELPCQVTVQ
jgi:hypothetical protein